jgi:hypothetical protein
MTRKRWRLPLKNKNEQGKGTCPKNRISICSKPYCGLKMSCLQPLMLQRFTLHAVYCIQLRKRASRPKWVQDHRRWAEEHQVPATWTHKLSWYAIPTSPWQLEGYVMMWLTLPDIQGTAGIRNFGKKEPRGLQGRIHKTRGTGMGMHRHLPA